MGNEWLQGGVGMIVLAFGAKYLLPLLRSTVEASTSRSGADATLHNLYQDLLVNQSKMAEDLAQARNEVARLTQEVSRLTRALADREKQHAH